MNRHRHQQMNLRSFLTLFLTSQAAYGFYFHRPSVIQSRLVRSAAEELYLSEENVETVLAECKETIGSMFGNSAENRGVGITGDVELVELDGPTVLLGLRGRFWHKRETVLARVGAFLQERIPEIVSVEVSDESMLLESNNDFEEAEPSLTRDANMVRDDQW